MFVGFFISQQAMATEHYFNFSERTAAGELTPYAANYGFLKSELSFSGALTSLSSQSFKDSNSGDLSEASGPLVTPKSISGGFGTSWGGWAMVIENEKNQIKLGGPRQEFLLRNESQYIYNNINAFLGVGLRLNENWSLGWSIKISQSEIEQTRILSGIESTKSFLDVIKEKDVVQSAQVGFGFLLTTSEVTFGLNIFSPKWALKSKRQLSEWMFDSLTQRPTLSEQDNQIEIQKEFILDEGVKFGSKGFIYYLGHTYSSLGANSFSGGFEYLGKKNWRVSTGIEWLEILGLRQTRWAVGFCRSKADFEWGVGPFYVVRQNKWFENVIDSNEMGVLYTSQINY